MPKTETLKLSYSGVIQTLVENENDLGGVILTYNPQEGITKIGIYGLTTAQVRGLACDLIEYAGELRREHDKP